MKKISKIFVYTLIIMGMLLIFANSCKKKNDPTPTPTPVTTTVTDIDGNVYHTVTIGTQVWMLENLKTTKYRNGNPIPNVTDVTAWSNLTTGAYCWYNNDAATYANTYGALYNWFTVNDSRNIAPTGWHVPSDAEWTTLTTFLGGEIVAGGKLKEAGTTHWNSPNTGANNSSSFSAVPGGGRASDGSIHGLGSDGYFWSASENDVSLAWSRCLAYGTAGLSRYDDNERNGFSVRCVRD